MRGYLLLMLVPCVGSAVIEVTAGGAVHEPTFRFTDSSGPIANLTSRSTGTIKASGDVESGSGASLEAMATQLAAAEAMIAQLNATVAQLDAQVTSLQSQVEGKMDAMSVGAVSWQSSSLATGHTIVEYVGLVRADLWGDIRFYICNPNGLTAGGCA